MTTPVLVVDDEPMVRKSLALALERAGATVITAADGQEALAKFREHKSAVIFSDVKMPGMDGFALLRSVKRLDPDTPVVLITGFGGEDVAARAEEAGAARVLNKPITTAELQQVLVTLLGQPDEAEPAAIITSNPQMEAMLSLARRVAKTDATVLVQGETGTGKEVLARFIHNESARADGPFVAVNCAALPESLIESELFGHERGSFTGAAGRREGRFAQSNGETLFLDEIGDMPPELQTRLLRVLSDGSYYRVGGHQQIKANVRVIAATHQNLQQRVREGTFREDLYHRLNVIRLRLPNLRERSEDLPLLTKHFLSMSAKQLNVEPKRLSDDALAHLARLEFPGNVRQLENLCHWLTVMAPGQVVDVGDLPAEFREPAATAVSDWLAALEHEAERRLARGESGILDALARQFERALITKALERTGGRRIEAANLLGMGRNTITRKIQELGIEDDKSAPDS